MLGNIVQSDAVDLLGSLASESVACIVTDPPYGIAFHSNRHKGKNPHAPITGDWNFPIDAFFRAADEALRPGGALYVFTRFDTYPIWSREVPPTLSLKNMIVWDKGNHSSGDLTGNFGFRHEVIMFMAKGRHVLRGKRWPNLWAVPRVSPSKLRMPAEKPVGLYERAILASSDPGDTVVDPFGGSCPMAEAAIRAGRNFIVGDVDRAMVRLGRERVGLPVEHIPDRPRPALVCPVMDVVPPQPALWGVHPEDLAEWRTGIPT